MNSIRFSHSSYYVTYSLRYKIFELIDRRASSDSKSDRIWAIDPVDGTKGFLRGGQYAVCLSLIVRGQVVIGVLGCPNLRLDAQIDEHDQKGHIFWSQQGQGAFRVSLSMASKLRKICFFQVFSTASPLCGHRYPGQTPALPTM